MIKIIKDGVKLFKATCPNCGCEFTYENEDINNSMVICPCCEQYLPHKGVIGTINTTPSPIPIWYNQQVAPDGYKIKDGLNEPLPSKYVLLKKTSDGAEIRQKVFSPDENPCDSCPNNPKYLKTPYVGDSPCQWCQMNPNKVTCTSNASKGAIK